MDARHVMRLHLTALFTSDAAGRLVAVNERGGAPAPRFFFGRTADGNVWRFGQTVAAALIADLTALCEAQSSGLRTEPDRMEAEPLLARLAVDRPGARVWCGPTFLVPDGLPVSADAVWVTAENLDVLSPLLVAWSEDVLRGVPVAAVLDDGKAVSVCASVRTAPHADEAGVETSPGFRGRGFGARAVAAWANLVREGDRLPLYSTSWENAPSRGLARKLGLEQYGTTLHAT